MDLYSREFMHYYKNQPYNKVLGDFTHSGKDSNTSCGDEVEVRMKINEGQIKDIGYQAEGCMVCQSSASILSEIITEERIEILRGMSEQDFFNNLKIELTPSRKKCALVSYNAFKEAVKNG